MVTLIGLVSLLFPQAGSAAADCDMKTKKVYTHCASCGILATSDQRKSCSKEKHKDKKGRQCCIKYAGCNGKSYNRPGECCKGKKPEKNGKKSGKCSGWEPNIALISYRCRGCKEQGPAANKVKHKTETDPKTRKEKVVCKDKKLEPFCEKSGQTPHVKSEK